MNRRQFLSAGIISPFVFKRPLKFKSSVNLTYEIELYIFRNGRIDIVELFGYMEIKNTKIEVFGEDTALSGKYGKITELLMPTKQYLDCDFIIQDHLKLEVYNVDFRFSQGYGIC